MTTRKKSILYSHAAWKIQTESPSQHHILLFLSAVADASGVSFHSYESIMTKTGYCRETVCRGLKYLRNVLKVLVWESGHGNQHTTKANRYALNLQKMTALAESAQSTRQTKRKSAQSTGLNSAKSTLPPAQSTLASGKSTEQTLRSHNIRERARNHKKQEGATDNSGRVGFEESRESFESGDPQTPDSPPDSLTAPPSTSTGAPPGLPEGCPPAPDGCRWVAVGNDFEAVPCE
jgi:hypothetical protein